MRAASVFSLLTLATCVRAGSINRYFRYFDEDGNGFITAPELKVNAVTSLRTG